MQRPNSIEIQTRIKNFILESLSEPQLGMLILMWAVMRQSGTWMTIWDDRILETLRSEGPMAVGSIAERNDIRVSDSTVSRRCSKLVEHGLTIHIGNGVYQITEEGEGYLNEEYDAENRVWLNGGERDGPTAGEETGEI